MTSSRKAVTEAANSGEQCTAPTEFKLNSHIRNNRVHDGPLVVLVDSETCSAAEMFTSFVAYNRLGEVIGVDVTTAGSTDSVSKSSQPDRAAENCSLPDDITIIGPFQKFYLSKSRYGDRLDNPIRPKTVNDREHVGLRPDITFYLSKLDIMYNDNDLFN